MTYKTPLQIEQRSRNWIMISTVCEESSVIPTGVPVASGGGGGIRTHGALARTTVFETAPFDHSGTPPRCTTGRLVSGLAHVAKGFVRFGVHAGSESGSHGAEPVRSAVFGIASGPSPGSEYRQRCEAFRLDAVGHGVDDPGHRSDRAPHTAGSTGGCGVAGRMVQDGSVSPHQCNAAAVRRRIPD